MSEVSSGPRIATIGVHGFDAESFLRRLQDADVELVFDVRQRRGVRGSEYAWANSRRLQEALADAGIFYEHRPELAPTTELRRLQYAEDDRLGVGKRARRELAAQYARRYTTEVLDHADLLPIASGLSGTRETGPSLRRARPLGWRTARSSPSGSPSSTVPWWSTSARSDADSLDEAGSRGAVGKDGVHPPKVGPRSHRPPLPGQ